MRIVMSSGNESGIDSGSTIVDRRATGPLVRLRRSWATVVVAVALTVSVVSPDPSGAVVDPSQGTLDDVPGTSPSSLGDLDLSERQYGDPTEALAMIQPPEVNNDGAARLEYPLLVPAGRAGVQPDLALTYDSGGGASWAGWGWDLSVGAVSVDTTYGAPRYLNTLESETYELDGDRLFPNAIRSSLVARNTTGVKDDFVRQVEGEHERIIRHGAAPDAYWWQVTDKDGTSRWYGGTPAGRDDTAVLTAQPTVAGESAGDFHWGLSYVEDISGNVMRFRYDELTNVAIGRGASGPTHPGVSLYLDSITYTGSVADALFGNGALDTPPYKVNFLRDADIAPIPTTRQDISVDARGGIPVVTRDLLRRVEVRHYAPGEALAGPGTLAAGYRLEYDTEAAFDKTLLMRVGQYGSDGPSAVEAWHDFEWFDDVRDGTGAYDGFADPVQWDSWDGVYDLNIAATSALGSGGRGGGDGGAYIGFNPVAPSKIGSFGGSFGIAGGQADDLSELADLDGDGLPDKVWVSGNQLMWGRNITTPQTALTDGMRFAAGEPLQNIDSLGRSRDIRIDLHFEAYPVASIQVGGGFGFTITERYFEDVNSDGRPDFIRPDMDNPPHQIVYFNTLVNGVPSFLDRSITTPVPLEQFDSTIVYTGDEDIDEIIIGSSPRIDTVRRWVAPFDGTVRVRGSAAYAGATGSAGDGLRVFIEHAGAQLFDEVVTAGSPPVNHDVTRAVSAGDAMYFRVHVIENGNDDTVAWAPSIDYVDGGGTTISAALDANGRSQVSYDAEQDFTLFGRDGARTGLPDAGPATLSVQLDRTGGLSDDVQIVVRHGRGAGPGTVLAPSAGTGALPAGAVGAAPTSATATYDFTVLAPEESGDSTITDWIEVDVVTDSPVDPRSLSVDVALVTATTGAPPDTTNPGGVDVPGAMGPIVIPNVRVFARTDRTSPFTPYTASETGEVSVNVNLSGIAPRAVSTPAVVTVKTATGGVIERTAFTVNSTPVPPSPFTIHHALNGGASVTFDAVSGTTYWVEVSAHDAGVAELLSLSSSASITVGTDEPASVNVPTQLHRPAVQGIFPSENRGWGVAGYNADHPDASTSGPINASLFDEVANTSGFDEDTVVPDANAAPSPGEVTGSPSEQFPGSYAYIAWAGPAGGPADRWRAAEKPTLYGQGALLRAARLGEDVALAVAPTTGGRPAPELLSLSGDFNFAIGLVASFSLAIGGGRALRDYTDLNGDGFPDIRVGGSTEYTGPRGQDTIDTTGALATSSTSLAVGGGLGGSPIAISGGEKHTKSGVIPVKNKAQPTSTKTSRGMRLGLGFGLSSEWTNPLAATISDAQAGGPGNQPDVGSGPEGVVDERALLDVNGDGLPDIVDTRTNGDMWVNLNLGHRFEGTQVLWSEGRVDAGKDVSGALSIGFQINAYEFAGGVAYTEGAGVGQFAWTDVDGDGTPDRLKAIDGAPGTTFGAADGMGGAGREVTYGTYPTGEVHLDVNPATSGDHPTSGVSLGEQFSVNRATGLSGGADFTIYIGPICLVACYIIINPGVHGGYDRTTTQISMMDMDGDGAPDMVQSRDGSDVSVRLNTKGKTNLLRAVSNPLGGEIRLDYERTGNTVALPESIWALRNVEVDDGRPGDGADVQTSTYTYDGNVYDRLLRTTLGFTDVTEHQLDTDGTLLRQIEKTYLAGTPFASGLQTADRLLDASDTLLEETTWSWSLVDAVPGPSLGSDAPAMPQVDDPDRVALFDLALAPRMRTEATRRVDADGDEQGTRTEFTYDALGNVLTETERNELETPADDTVTTYGYLDCTSPRDSASWVGVPQTVTVRAGSALGPVLRQRVGDDGICGNAVPVTIRELQGTDACGAQIWAETKLKFDSYGSYDAILHPPNRLVGAINPADCPAAAAPPLQDTSFTGCESPGVVPADPEVGDPPLADQTDRYCVQYVYDDHRFTDISRVTDSHGVSSVATYDRATGRLASRADESGNLTVYRYDAVGRTAAVAAPREQASFVAGTGPATVAYDYGLPSDGHAWAVARHHDAFNADGDPVNDTIDTTTFVDGVGRVVQRKQDALVDGVAGPSVIVEGAVDFDALGREVTIWYPVVEPAATWPASGLPAHLTTYNTHNSSLDTAVTGVPTTDPTTQTFDLLDRRTSTTAPDGSVESTAYDIANDPETGLLVAAPTDTDQLGKDTRRFFDIRGLVLTQLDFPAPLSGPATGDLLATLPTAGIAATPRLAASVATGAAPLTTVFAYDGLGRLVSATDAEGATTTHVYDQLDNRIASTTPDGGLVRSWFTPVGSVGRVVDAVHRELSFAVTRRYDRDRLVDVLYPPDGTPDVQYLYGAYDDPAGNVAGRVTSVEDGAMTRTYSYDVDGNVATETATRQLDPFEKGNTELPPVFTTAWEHDSLGRLRTLTYPEGEVLTHEYDLGGLPTRLHAQVPQPDRYDAALTPLPQPDDLVVYVNEVRYDEFREATFLRTGTGVETTWERDDDRLMLTNVDTDSTVMPQYDGSTSTARPLQRLTYTYDAVGNVRDAANRLYDGGSATSLADLGRVPENGVPGPAQHAYTHDQHYRLTGDTARYIDRQETRDASYLVDRGPNGTLRSKTQTTTTTGTTGNGGSTKGGKSGGKSGGKGSGNSKKGDGSSQPVDGTSSTTNTCDGDTNSGGGTSNQDPHRTFTYAPADLVYDAARPQVLLRAGDRTHEYDANGNLTRWVQPCSSTTQIREYAWDAENRLVYIGQGNNDTDMRYSAEGARALERGPGGTTWFVNEHWRLVNGGHRYATIYLGDRPVASHRSSPPPAPPTLCDDTVSSWDPVTSTCGPTISRTIHFMHSDLQGSLRVATDEVGSVFQHLEYLPSGQPWVAGQSRVKDTPYLFAGGWTDETYDLVSFGDRWYDPRLERFATPDPLLQDDPEAVIDDPTLLSAYTYAAGNPLRYTDPDGRAAFDIGAGAAKHLRGDATISDVRREARPAPAITFGGRYSNDAKGQQRQQRAQDAADLIERFTTIYSFEGDGNRHRVFGFTVKEDKSPSPQPGATSPTATSTQASATGPGATDTTTPTASAHAGTSPQTSGTGSAAGPSATGPPSGSGAGGTTAPPSNSPAPDSNQGSASGAALQDGS